MTWQDSLQYIGGVFVLVSLIVFLAMAIGRRPDYAQAFLAVWMMSIFLAAGWLGAGLFFVLWGVFNNPVLFAAVAGVAFVVWRVWFRRVWLPRWRRWRWNAYLNRKAADELRQAEED